MDLFSSVGAPHASAPSSPSSSDVDQALARLGFDAFRPGQRESIETLLTEGRLLLVAPTGGGKSLIYQLPASILPGTSLVISPLIALMHDQVRALQELGISAAFLNSSMTAAEQRDVIEQLRSEQLKLLYIAPERLECCAVMRLHFFSFRRTRYISGISRSTLARYSRRSWLAPSRLAWLSISSRSGAARAVRPEEN